MDNILSSLFGDDESDEISNEIAEEVVENPVEEVSEETEEQEAETSDEADTVEVEEDHSDHTGKTVPVGALKGERNKRQEAERKAAEYQRQLDEIRSQPRPLDEYSNDTYFDNFRAKMRAEMFDERLYDSDERAREKHGVDAVKEAADWASKRFESDPTLLNNFQTSRRPIEFLVEQHKRDRALTEVLSDEEAFFRANAAKYGFAPVSATTDDGAASEEYSPAAVTTKPTGKPMPKRSLAGGQSQGRATQMSKGDDSIVGSLFR